MLIMDVSGMFNGTVVLLVLLVVFAILGLIVWGIFAFLNKISSRIDSKKNDNNTVSKKEKSKKSNLVIEDPIIAKLNSSDSEINTSNGGLRGIIEWILIIGLCILVIFILVIIVISFFK